MPESSVHLSQEKERVGIAVLDREDELDTLQPGYAIAPLERKGERVEGYMHVE